MDEIQRLQKQITLDYIEQADKAYEEYKRRLRDMTPPITYHAEFRAGPMVNPDWMVKNGIHPDSIPPDMRPSAEALRQATNNPKGPGYTNE